jgi:phosphate acetyltransferase
MTTSIYISTLEPGSGKALLALGILDLASRKTAKLGFFKPLIEATDQNNQNKDIELICKQFNLKQNYEASFGLLENEAIKLTNEHKADEILDIVITKYKALEAKCDFILCESSDYLGKNANFELELNFAIAENLGCPIVILANGEQRTIDDIVSNVKVAFDEYKEKECKIIGIVVNKVAPEQVEPLKKELASDYNDSDYILKIIPYSSRLNRPRVREVAQQINASILYGESRLDSLVSDYLVTAMQVGNALNWLDNGQLIITPGDRSDIILAMLEADQSANYPTLAGIILSGDLQPPASVCKLIDGLVNPLPILGVKTDTYHTIIQAREVKTKLTVEDQDKIRWSLNLFEKYVDSSELENRLSQIHTHGVTPKMFIYNLQQQAKSDPKRIVLPEAEDQRILQAASFLLSQNIVDLILLGTRNEIYNSIKKYDINLDLDRLTIIDPRENNHQEEYVEIFYNLRKHKGITLDGAKDIMTDVSYFGTMMVYCGDAEGMVSGAIHTTQHTIRPSLQIIKTKPGFSLVSSVFLMCLETRILVYGDCAVNPNPNPQQLAEIALSSAETATIFGIDPRVALLSYSSGTSGKGEEVEKVREAVNIAHKRQPELKLEGPMQYDAAVSPSVAAQKMPNSQVAGKASVFIFPDLNTGNNTYKAVQRESGAIAIGPILQGLKKPVNDLSRGCTVEDIINTVAITAIQAQHTSV